MSYIKLTLGLGPSQKVVYLPEDWYAQSHLAPPLAEAERDDFLKKLIAGLFKSAAARKIFNRSLIKNPHKRSIEHSAAFYIETIKKQPSGFFFKLIDLNENVSEKIPLSTTITEVSTLVIETDIRLERVENDPREQAQLIKAEKTGLDEEKERLTRQRLNKLIRRLDSYLKADEKELSLGPRNRKTVFPKKVKYGIDGRGLSKGGSKILSELIAKYFKYIVEVQDLDRDLLKLSPQLRAQGPLVIKPELVHQWKTRLITKAQRAVDVAVAENRNREFYESSLKHVNGLAKQTERDWIQQLTCSSEFQETVDEINECSRCLKALKKIYLDGLNLLKEMKELEDCITRNDSYYHRHCFLISDLGEQAEIYHLAKKGAGQEGLYRKFFASISELYLKLQQNGVPPTFNEFQTLLKDQYAQVSSDIINYKKNLKILIQVINSKYTERKSAIWASEVLERISFKINSKIEELLSYTQIKVSGSYFKNELNHLISQMQSYLQYLEMNKKRLFSASHKEVHQITAEIEKLYHKDVSSLFQQAKEIEDRALLLKAIKEDVHPETPLIIYKCLNQDEKSSVQPLKVAATEELMMHLHDDNLKLLKAQLELFKSIKKILLASQFWREQVSVFNLKQMPDGIASMLANALKRPGLSLTERINTLRHIAELRLLDEDIFGEKPLLRCQVTQDFYELIRAIALNEHFNNIDYLANLNERVNAFYKDRIQIKSVQNVSLFFRSQEPEPVKPASNKATTLRHTSDNLPKCPR